MLKPGHPDSAHNQGIKLGLIPLYQSPWRDVSSLSVCLFSHSMRLIKVVI